MSSRRTVLTVLLAVALAVAGVVLLDVVGTVFFAVTVAYVLVPLQKWFRTRGLGRRWATAATTALAVLGALLPLGTIGYLLYAARGRVLGALEALPETVVIEVAGAVYSLETAALVADVTALAESFAVPVARALPTLALKLALFGLVVFGLLVRHRAATRAVLAPVPPPYRDVVWRLHERVRGTLFGIYVIQVATGVATALFAYPAFLLLGYDAAVTLAVLSGVLQFLPIVGPSVVVLALAAFQVTVGPAVEAVVVTVVGLLVVAALPDLVVRPYLARGTADLDGSLYFVGFVGGLLTVGAVGVIAGPLVVALVVETGQLLAEETATDEGEPP